MAIKGGKGLSGNQTNKQKKSYAVGITEQDK